MIEEATQSHSSLDMLKKQEFNLFHQKELVDSDDEEETADKRSSVVVILIDEVDNLYEDHGDNGFWTALNELTKRSKCPIFLTANVVPPGINCCRCDHLELPQPTPDECVPAITKILEAEGFRFAPVDEKQLLEGLLSMAKLCNCDLRHMLQELQSFAYSAVTESHQPVDMSTLPRSNASLLSSLPSIVKVEPHSVRSEDHVLLTIKGSNLLALANTRLPLDACYDVTVFVGDKVCPHAQIMDDSTILAVKSPSALQPDANPGAAFGFRQANMIEKLQLRVYSTLKAGGASTSEAGILVTELPDGRAVVSVQPPCSLECWSSTATVEKAAEKDQEGDSGSEAEFDGGSCGRPSSEQSGTAKSTQTAPLDANAASQLFQDGINSWTGDKLDLPATLTPDKEAEVAMCELSVRAALASDAALFADPSLKGVPYLAGPCRGFGFDLTEAYPVSTNEKSKL